MLIGDVFPRPAYHAAVVLFVCSLWVYPFPVLEFLDSATVEDTVIRVGDIARIRGMDDAHELRRLAYIPVGEAAPASFGRFVGVNEAMLIVAREGFRLCRAKALTSDRVMVKTGFQEKNIENFERDIALFIRANVGWDSADYTIAVCNPRDHISCLKAPYTLKIEGLPSNYPKGNFSLKLVLSQGSRCYSMHANCSMKVMTSVVVAVAAIPRDAPCNETNCRMEKRDVTHFKYAPYVLVSDVWEKKAARTIGPGAILHEKMLRKMPDVRRDQQVQVLVTSGNVKVSMTARAREDGVIGEQIWVENEMTHKLLKTTVIASGKTMLSQGEKTL